MREIVPFYGLNPSTYGSSRTFSQKVFGVWFRGISSFSDSVWIHRVWMILWKHPKMESAKFMLKILRVMISNKPLNSLNIQKHHHKLMILRYCTLSNHTSGFQASTIGISAMNGYMWYALEFMANWIGKIRVETIGFCWYSMLKKKRRFSGYRGGNLKIKPRELSKRTWDIIIKIGYQSGQKIWFKPKPETGQRRTCEHANRMSRRWHVRPSTTRMCVFFQNIKETLD